MPLRDHFRPPLDEMRHWEGLHGGWPMMIVAGLRRHLPKGYFAEPRVHFQDVYQVRVYDERRHCRLVAAVEIVSPANKDRPENRRAFVAKCTGLLRENVSIVIVDIVSTRRQNLFGELLEFIGTADPSPSVDASALYASACRLVKRDEAWTLESWHYPLELANPLPTLPLWLAPELAVPLDLEESYERSCEILDIP